MEELTEREYAMLLVVQRTECLQGLTLRGKGMASDLSKRGFLSYAYNDPCPNAYLTEKGEQYILDKEQSGKSSR